MPWYLDTSAAARLIVAEAETTALRTWLAGLDAPPVASELVATELLRAVRRAAPDRLPAVRGVMDAVTVLAVSSRVCERAGSLDPLPLRSLDALHLASALELGRELDGGCTYDERLATAALAHGLTIAAPR